MFDSIYPSEIYSKSFIRDFFNNFIQISIKGNNFEPYYTDLDSEPEILKKERQLFKCILLFEQNYDSFFREFNGKAVTRRSCVEQAYLYTPIALKILQEEFRTLLGQFAFLDTDGNFDQEEVSSVVLPIIFYSKDNNQPWNQLISLKGLYDTLFRANKIFKGNHDKNQQLISDDEKIIIETFLNDLHLKFMEKTENSSCEISMTIDDEILKPFFNGIVKDQHGKIKTVCIEDESYISFKKFVEDFEKKDELTETILILHTLFKFGLQFIKNILLKLKTDKEIFRKYYFNQDIASELEKEHGIYLLEEGEIVLGILLDYIFKNETKEKCRFSLDEVLTDIGLIEDGNYLISISNVVLWLQRAFGTGPYENVFKDNFRQIISELFKFKNKEHLKNLTSLVEDIKEIDNRKDLQKEKIDELFNFILDVAKYEEVPTLRFLKDYRKVFSLFSYNKEISRAELSFRFISDINIANKDYYCFYFTDFDGKELLAKEKLKDYKNEVSRIFNKYASLSTYLGVSAVRNRIEKDLIKTAEFTTIASILISMAHALKKYVTFIKSFTDLEKIGEKEKTIIRKAADEIFNIIMVFEDIKSGKPIKIEPIALSELVNSTKEIVKDTFEYGKSSKDYRLKLGEDRANFKVYFILNNYKIPVYCKNLIRFQEVQTKFNSTLFRILMDEMILNLYRHTRMKFDLSDRQNEKLRTKIFSKYDAAKIEFVADKKDKCIEIYFYHIDTSNINSQVSKINLFKEAEIAPIRRPDASLAKGIFLNYQIVEKLGWKLEDPYFSLIEEYNIYYFVQIIKIPGIVNA